MLSRALTITLAHATIQAALPGMVVGVATHQVRGGFDAVVRVDGRKGGAFSRTGLSLAVPRCRATCTGKLRNW